MIYVCTVAACGQLFDMRGDDHRPQPCLACWREGWRTDDFGNTYQELARVPPHPADDVHAE